MRVRVNNFRLENPKMVKPLRLAVISDVHNNQATFKTLLKTISALRPDYICLVGDTLDRADAEIDEVVTWLRQLAQIARVIVALGNHELVAYGKQGWQTRAAENTAFYREVAKIKNCLLLKDRFAIAVEPAITFSAINMPEAWYRAREPQADFLAVARAVPAATLTADKFNVLLSHSPSGWLVKNRLRTPVEIPLLSKVDLILSGHHHGGLVPGALRPLLRQRGLAGPHFRVGQPHAFGTWTSEETALVLSNGVTKFAATAHLATVGRGLNRLFIPDVENILLTPGPRHRLQEGV